MAGSASRVWMGVERLGSLGRHQADTPLLYPLLKSPAQDNRGTWCSNPAVPASEGSVVRTARVAVVSAPAFRSHPTSCVSVPACPSSWQKLGGGPALGTSAVSEQLGLSAPAERSRFQTQQVGKQHPLLGKQSGSRRPTGCRLRTPPRRPRAASLLAPRWDQHNEQGDN